MPVYRFRVTFEDHEDLLRDIEIKPSQTLQDLHKAILSSIRFDTDRETIFFTCNDHWRKEESFSPDQYASKKLVNLVEDPHQKLLFEFDTDRPWTLYLELFRIVPDETGAGYPRCVKEVGMNPPQIRIQPTDPDLLEEDEDEVSETIKASGIYDQGVADFDTSSISEDETPEGEEDTGDEKEESDYPEAEDDYTPSREEEDY